MKENILHRWDLPPKEAIALQKELASRVEWDDRLDEVRLIAGVDMGINKHTEKGRAAVVLLTYPELTLLEQHVYEEPLQMPYVPGLLSFREAPSVLGAFRQLSQKPDLLMVDGLGVAHPRRLGIASHLGIWLDIPTIGCGKSVYVGKYDKEALGEDRGSWQPLIDKDQIVGAALRTRPRGNPMIISPGHRIGLATSLRYVLDCGRGYRLPEPTRLADKLSKDYLWKEEFSTPPLF